MLQKLLLVVTFSYLEGDKTKMVTKSSRISALCDITKDRALCFSSHFLKAEQAKEVKNATLIVETSLRGCTLICGNTSKVKLV